MDAIEPNILEEIMTARANGELEQQQMTFDSETGTPEAVKEFSLSSEFQSVAPDTTATPAPTVPSMGM